MDDANQYVDFTNKGREAVVSKIEELFKNKVDSIKRTNPMVIGVDEFESIGSEYSGEVEDKSVTLEDEFTIT